MSPCQQGTLGLADVKARYGNPEGPSHLWGLQRPTAPRLPDPRILHPLETPGSCSWSPPRQQRAPGTSALPAWKRRWSKGGGSSARDCDRQPGSACRLNHGCVPGEGSYLGQETAPRPSVSTSAATVSLSRAAIVTGEWAGANGLHLRRPGAEGVRPALAAEAWSPYGPGVFGVSVD